MPPQDKKNKKKKQVNGIKFSSERVENLVLKESMPMQNEIQWMGEIDDSIYYENGRSVWLPINSTHLLVGRCQSGFSIAAVAAAINSQIRL